MVRLSTEVTLPELPPLSYADGVVLLGSCFAEAMGRRLYDAHFRATVNSHGTLFNPASICRTVEAALEGQLPGRGELLEQGGRWVHVDYHSDLAGGSVEESLGLIGEAHTTLRGALAEASWLVLTLGTAWVYEAAGRTVANCHRLPATSFARRRLGVEETVGLLAGMEARVRGLNPGLRVMYTVSPVRHARDGMRENQVSKAVLLLALDELVGRHDADFYFPAYEVFMDELRDYRFYGADLVHPSELGERVMWDRLQGAWLGPEAQRVAERVQKVRAAVGHKPTQPNSAESRAFFGRLLGQMDELEGVPGLRPFGEERQAIARWLE